MSADDRSVDRVHATLLDTDRWLARYVARPVLEFLHVEQASGVVLLAATVVALVWANSPWDAGYHTLWETELLIESGPFHFEVTVKEFVNDALMAVFFFVVGLEIKRELVAGELRSPRTAALPAVAAVGGMVVPALLYVVLNVGGEGSRGWGIPMATDIAFALGVIAVLGNRVPASLRIFLLTLAIVDDIGAIAVIAVFYTEDLSFGWLGIALAGLGLVAALKQVRVWQVGVYVAVGGFVWFAAHESGVHATIAGVALGLMAPARPLLPEVVSRDVVDRVRGSATPGEVRRVSFLIKESTSIAERLEHVLHPWTSFVVLPLFALANAGVALGGGAIGDAASSAIGLGIALGLVVGKPLGIGVAAWLAVRFGLARLPRAVTWPQVVSVGAVAGIGFTVSLFITNLAFGEGEVTETAKVGVLGSSAVAAVLGGLALRASTPARAAEPATGDDAPVTGAEP